MSAVADQPVPYWPPLYTPAAPGWDSAVDGVAPCGYHLTVAGDAALDHDLAVDAQPEAEAG